MRLRTRRRNAGRRLAAVGGSAVDLGPNDILTITNDGSDNLLFTTAAPHGITAPVIITVSGASLAAYNGSHTVDDTPTPTTFVEAGGGYQGDSTGGQWAFL